MKLIPFRRSSGPAARPRRGPLRRLLARVSERLKRPLRAVRRGAGALRFRGRGRWCPVCRGGSRTFLPFGEPPRGDAECARCGALERHRLAWLFLQRRTDFFEGPRGRRMLHVAPEPALSGRFRRAVGRGYLGADLDGPLATASMDVTRIPYPDGWFDVIFCSHVLEHVADDRAAMRELRRVLSPGGWALLLVPVLAAETREDPSITDPDARRRAFGQDDPRRVYGRDYPDRLRDAGFRVVVAYPGDVASPEEVVRMGLTPAAGEIYQCFRT